MADNAFQVVRLISVCQFADGTFDCNAHLAGGQEHTSVINVDADTAIEFVTKVLKP